MRVATIRSWIDGLLRRRRVEADLRAEIDAHLEARTADLIARGMAADAARRQARIEFGSIERYKDEVRYARGIGAVDTLRADLRSGLRALGRARVFATVAVVSLALGIGANTLVFSILSGAVLTPPALPDAERVVMLWNLPDASKPDQLGTSSITRYAAIRQFAHSFEAVGAYNGIACGVRTLGYEDGRTPPERITGQTMSPSMFQVLGVQPILGRAFTDAEDVADQVAPVVLITYQTWQRRFAGDRAVVGKVMTLDRTPTTIIGVLPERFDFFAPGIEFVAPLCLTRAQVESRVGGNTVVGRLKVGVTVTQAQQELDALTSRLAAQDPVHHRGLGTRIESVQRSRGRLLNTNGQPFNDYGAALMILQAAVGFVLLIACANVAGLLLARSAARQHEVSVRVAIGAWRGRIVRQVVTESVPLVLLGAAAGVALAWVGLHIFVAVAPADFPRLQRLSIDMRVLAFTAAIALGSNLLFTLLPAWKASNAPLAGALHGARRTGTDAPRRQWLRSVLVAGQIAVAVVLLTGAGLMIRSVTAALTSHLGADTSRLLAFDFRVPPREAFKQIGLYGTSGLFAVSPKPAQTVDRVVERLQKVPGIESVAAVNVPLFGGQSVSLPFSIEGRAFDTRATGTAESLPHADYVAITPDFFATLRIPLRQGRDVQRDDDDRRPFVAIVNETFARRFFPGQDVIGQHVRFHLLPQDPAREIVGVVADVATGRLDTQINPTIYVPHEQQTAQSVGPSVYMRAGMYVVVRAGGEPERLVASIKRAVAEVDPTTPVANAKSVERTLDDQVRFMRLYTLLLVGFGGVAVVLAAIGVYGVVAYSVAQRTREFGLRIALGAATADVLALVGGYAARVIAAGMVSGLLIALTASRTLRSWLFGVTATDPATYAAVVLLLIVVSAAACLLPARRAAIVDPTMALRHE